MCSSDLLKSEFLEVELLAINIEVQRLVQLRRSPTLKLTYQEQWETLQTRASELLSTISQKCIKIHNAASMHYASLVHLVEDQDPLYIVNTPSFPESEYLTREARIFKLLRQTIVKQQEDAKAREDLLLQKQLELEAALKSKEDLIAQLMNQQPNPYKHTYFLYFASIFYSFFFITLYSSSLYIYIKFFFYSESFMFVYVFLHFTFLFYFFVNDKRGSNRKYLTKTLSPS